DAEYESPMEQEMSLEEQEVDVAFVDRCKWQVWG
ncbi:hypothetical protein A2U01_0105565, partial [Trifolium medium]|nr:hypothetical protein [Trifolium medium]